MSTLSRRDLCQSLPLLALLPTLSAHAQTPQTAAEPVAAADCTMLTLCEAIPTVPGSSTHPGITGHGILHGQIPGITHIEVHETKLDPGKAPHPPHRHPHAELMLIREGSLEFTSDAPPVTITAGGTIYCAPNQLHGIHNNGNTQTVYYVVEIGGQQPCTK
jgi:mannose-6-phosphate isomerase-like protein (cupin superfamily)